MLRVTLHVNEKQIGDWEVRNVTDPEKLTLTGPCRYEVRAIDDDWAPDSPPLFTLMHRRVDGAEELAAAVLKRLSRWGDGR